MSKVKNSKRFYWKGKLVSEKIYNQRLVQQQSGRNSAVRRLTPKQTETARNLQYDEFEPPKQTETASNLQYDEFKPPKLTETASNFQYDEFEPPKPAEGRRIVELLVLGNQLWCTNCKECLSLSNIEREQRRGLGSILSVRCHKCSLINIMSTGQQHSTPENPHRMTRFDVNTKLVIGMIHSGIGYTNLNKLLTCLNIPEIDFKTYKRYQEEAGKAIVSLAKQSCEEATELERKFTLENLPALREDL